MIKIVGGGFRENRYFVFWDTSEGPLFLDPVCSDSPGIDLGWVDSYILKMNKPRPAVHSSERCMHHTYTNRDAVYQKTCSYNLGEGAENV
jgi:hypothetical protein